MDFLEYQWISSDSRDIEEAINSGNKDAELAGWLFM